MTDETVLITGCSSGIGRATAEAFLAAEWTVWATARDESDLAALREAGARTAELDVTKPAQCQEVVEELVAAERRLDCLVNNAGYGQMGAVEDVPTRRVHKQFDVNVYGPHRLVRAVLPHMREREAGTIVNVSSVVGRVSTPGQGVYAASKFALEALSDALRGEVEPHGIDVALIEPGPVDTEFGERVSEELEPVGSSGAYDRVYRFLEGFDTVSNGFATSAPEDVAAAVLEAASTTRPAARYPVGPAAKAMSLARYLPDRLRDRVVNALYDLA
ncbi:NAD(P)-dependent dehydrogenase (short-subunit alcohol dehydrogenase family) [Halarchaeum solikamskense]|uniref:SDR family oxidoreductase n=1 Tax=Halarchaeum nitratireducens TaxID=489913 RepID=UPI001B3A7DF0|nr:SDR family oxidoreductase [Halarchaeum solikamskense]MBP2251499.1 NAD(P)-dependent dehydrogenase (short-subunit alcohol dehydrogenase family) [Halarchaeum solikamskense]